MSSNNRLETKTFGGYGGPLIQFSNFSNDWGIPIGGKGGFVINRRIAFGGIGMGLVHRIDFLGDNLNDSIDASVSLDYAASGLFSEYIFKLESPIHFSIPVNVMDEEISENNAISNAEVESSGVLVIEPGLI